MLREYSTWAFTLQAGSDAAPTFEGLEQELETLPGIYAPLNGRRLLAMHDGQPAGCIALKPVDATTGELKRLYVRPAFRGHAIGSQLVVIDAARTSGHRRMILDSHLSMTDAHAIYMDAGFRRVSAPLGFPEAFIPYVVFMDMQLDEIA